MASDAAAGAAPSPNAATRTAASASSEQRVLLLSVFTVGLCTILYELLIGTASSYLMGDSITEFSLTIGLAMAAMGVGTYLSRFLHDQLLAWFVGLEVALGVVGGFAVLGLFAAFGLPSMYHFAMVAATLLIGTLIGVEIPLLTRLMAERRQAAQRALQQAFSTSIADVLSLDYVGALAATLLFPFVLLPRLGLVRTGAVAGLLNLGVAAATLWCLQSHLSQCARRYLTLATVVAATLVVAALTVGPGWAQLWEQTLFEDPVVYAAQSPYQKIVVTVDHGDRRLYLNGHLQFSSADEYRYHEALVHISMGLSASAARPRHVLVLGGGDGLAVREILKWPQVAQVTLVDLDPAVTGLAQQPLLASLNHDSLQHPAVQVINADAFGFLQQTQQRFDVILIDLPDPNSTALARLYSTTFYRLVHQRLTASGVVATQATSPYYAREAFWCIRKTLQEAGFGQTLPYHVNVPSMGDWGFVAASSRRAPLTAAQVQLPPAPLQFLSPEGLDRLFVFAKDTAPPAKACTTSTLNNPTVLEYYLAGWKQWN